MGGGGSYMTRNNIGNTERESKHLKWTGNDPIDTCPPLIVLLDSFLQPMKLASFLCPRSFFALFDGYIQATIVLWTLWIEPSVGLVFNRYPPPPPSGKRHFCSSFFVKRKNSVIASSGLLALFTNGGRNYFWCLYINIWWLLWRLYVIMEYIYSYIETDFWWCRCFWPLIWRALPIDQPTATPVSLIWIISLFLNKRLCV